jgi:hypothetical protein
LQVVVLRDQRDHLGDRGDCGEWLAPRRGTRGNSWLIAAFGRRL